MRLQNLQKQIQTGTKINNNREAFAEQIKVIKVKRKIVLKVFIKVKRIVNIFFQKTLTSQII